MNDIQSKNIGEGTRIWQYSVILEKAVIGKDCNICAHTFIENDVIIGDRVTIKCGVYLWDGMIVEDDVFIGPNATFTNDKYPRSKKWDIPKLLVRIGKGASIGANATICPGITLGAYCLIGAGSVVTKDVPERAVIIGNPGTVVRYVTEDRAYD